MEDWRSAHGQKSRRRDTAIVDHLPPHGIRTRYGGRGGDLTVTFFVTKKERSAEKHDGDREEGENKTGFLQALEAG